MWRYGILAAAIVVAVVAVLAFRGKHGGESAARSAPAKAPSADTRGARIVHYRLDGRDQVAVVPQKPNGRLLVLLHARGAGPEQFLTNAFFAELGSTASPTVVMLNGGDHSFWHNRNGGRWASMVLDEAIPDAERRFHTTGKVGIGGISMGGYGALHIASLRPSEFCGVGAHSAALWRRSGATAPGAFDNPEDYRANNVFRAIGKLKKTQVWMDVGDGDSFRAADSELARKLSVVLHVYPGGHDSAYWNARMPMYFAFYRQACS
jgi:S-formylglutathione hydrolase FrmB